jgi:hypothetical protein
LVPSRDIGGSFINQHRRIIALIERHEPAYIDLVNAQVLRGLVHVDAH